MAPLTNYDEKTFNLDFEKTAGYLQPGQFPPLDWSVRSQVEKVFPFYRREQIKYDAAGGQRSKVIEIDAFNLKTPDGTNPLFVNTKLYIEGFKRCALYGINGSGKTTLFEAISSGSVKDFPTYINVHHMKELEHNEEADKVSVMDTVLCSHPFRRVLLACKIQLEALLEDPVWEERKEGLEDNLTYVNIALGQCHGDYAEDTCRSMLRVLGFDEVGEKAPLSSLSGGLRMRVALASAFFVQSEMLLLDEPTNHLDMPSVLWLENKLRGYKGSFLLVTHDRTLLENVVTSVMLIQDLKLEYYNCEFKEFEKRKELDDKKRDKMIETFLKRNTNLNPMSPLIKTQNEYRKWQADRRERAINLEGKFKFIAPKPLKGPEGLAQEEISLINIENVRFSYDTEAGLPYIFDTPVSFNVKQGTRVGVMGPNV
jgi:ATPase subunit of ABC transporter with duplicated ATPase domains